MRMQQRTRRGRPAGFTLIELLVVIAIIAVLVSLTAAAVMKMYAKGPEVKTRAEIGNMEIAINTVLTQQGNGTLNYLPSKLILREDGQYTAANANGVAATLASYQVTVRVLTALFGKGCIGQPIDWNGDGKFNTAAGAAGDWVLEGQECLVFFLGGIPTDPGSNPNCLGFSNNPSQPGFLAFSASSPQPGKAKVGAQFPFDAARLKRSTRAQAPNFLVYADAYKTGVPYAYFSNNGAGNDYVSTDCASLNVAPYFTTSKVGASTVVTFINPKGCQIISAGSDGVFGLINATGTNWNPNTGYTSGNGQDDQVNFSSKMLGTKVQ